MLPLLTVERVVKLEGRGFVVTPDLPAWPGDPEVDDTAELRLPDGRCVRFRLQVCLVHYNRTLESVRAGDPAWARSCLVQGMSSEPEPGSEIWCRDDLVHLARQARGDDAG